MGKHSQNLAFKNFRSCVKFENTEGFKTVPTLQKTAKWSTFMDNITISWRYMIFAVLFHFDSYSQDQLYFCSYLYSPHKRQVKQINQLINPRASHLLLMA